YNDCVRLISNRRFPHFKSQVFGLDILKFGVALCCVAFHIFHDRALFIEVGERAFFAHVGEAHGVGLKLLLALLFEVGQAEILEDHRRQLLHRDFGLVVVVASIFASIALLPFALARLLGHHVAHFALAVALTGMRLATWIVAETILIQGANGDAHHLFAIGENDALFADNIT